MLRRVGPLMALVCAASSAEFAAAWTFSWDIPQLVRSYDTSDATPTPVTVDMGVIFSQITGTSLSITGNQALGSIPNPPSDGIPLGSSIFAYVPQSGGPFKAYAAVDLFETSGSFSFNLPFVGEDSNGHPQTPNLAPWLDGSAELDVQVAAALIFTDGGGPDPSITYPAVNITSARLSITGDIQAVYSADFNRDARVDASDLAAWSAAFGGLGSADANLDGDTDGMDFLYWQKQLGNTWSLNPARAVPEPGAAWLAACVAVLATKDPHARSRGTCRHG